MSIEAHYTCGTCGISFTAPSHMAIGKAAKDTKLPRVVAKTELWHECCDGYVVPLQCEVQKIK